jgi:hypothetical protein
MAAGQRGGLDAFHLLQLARLFKTHARIDAEQVGDGDLPLEGRQLTAWRMRRCSSERVTPASRAARDRETSWGMEHLDAGKIGGRALRRSLSPTPSSAWGQSPAATMRTTSIIRFT